MNISSSSSSTYVNNASRTRAFLVLRPVWILKAWSRLCFPAHRPKLISRMLCANRQFGNRRFTAKPYADEYCPKQIFWKLIEHKFLEQHVFQCDERGFVFKRL